MPLEADALDAPDPSRQWALAALGALLTGTAVLHFGQHADAPDPMVVAATVGPAVGVLAYGLWFWRGSQTAPRGDAVFVWAVGGAGLVLALDLWAVYANAYGSIAIQHVFVQHSSVGALGGAVAGTYAERDRWRARSRLRLLRALDSAMDGIAVLDDDRTIRYANSSFAATHGVDDASAVVGRSWRTSYPPVTRERVAEVLDELDEGDDDAWQGTVTAARDDDTTYPQEVSMSTVEDGYVWVCRDVTRREERDQRLRVLNRVLRHDTRNALNVVLGRTDRLAAQVDESDVEEDMTAVREAAESLLDTSEKARRLEDALARDDAGAEPVDDLVGHEVTAVRKEHPDATITVSGSADALVDERLRLPVHELLMNAVEHTTSATETVADGSQPRGDGGNGGEHAGGDSPRVEVSVSSDPLTVRVSDDGPGIPENERRALSGVEETPLQHGSGVGLWLVYWVVSQTGGAVEVADGDVVLRPAGKN
ncbi:sensor histidine kinase [Halobacterium rubrum]|uniref:sensor histidine kinase n=1 Tax=Halobacterium TaxID=2239 RepID=UPI001F332378|nr:PAS domain-containing sensor histidine kinase [Halobacterium rubrum]MDH5019996.1 PAS domain-containing protein [Halobacterium rubrum]